MPYMFLPVSIVPFIVCLVLSVALMYCSIDSLIGKVRDTEDEFNSIGAATLAGMIFKSTGIVNCFSSGVINLGKICFHKQNAYNQNEFGHFLDVNNIKLLWFQIPP